MRVLILGALFAAGCTSAREKDCRVLLPRIDAAHAKPSDESAASVRSFTANDPALREPMSTYAKAIERQVGSIKALAELASALKLRKSDGPPFRLEMFDPSRPHAERLVGRCLPASPPPDCAALSSALEACVTPAADDTTAEEQLLTCASRFAAVHSDDAEANESIQALAATIRDLEPFARNVGAPAKDVIRVAKALSPRINDQSKARADANLAEMQIRALCQSK